MSQQLSPWVEGAYGWNYGESNWNAGMDQNLLKFSFLFDRNVDAIVSSLPTAINGKAYYNTVDHRIYFAVGTTYYSTVVPRWFTVIVKTTGDTWQFNGNSLVQIGNIADLDTRLTEVELTIETLGTAAFQSADNFATQAELDVVEGQAQSYTDTLGTSLSNLTDIMKGASLVGYKNRSLRERLSDYVSVADFGVFPSAVIDNTLKIQASMNETATAGKTLFFPAGTYLVSGLNTLTNLKMVGEFYQTTILKLKNGSNTGILNHSGGAAGDDYIYVSGFTFDGNSANNTAGDCVTLRGIRPTLTDCIIKNSAERAVVTDWILAGQPVGYGGLTGAQGFFERITIANSNKTGWTHYAPTDSWFNCIDFLNCGLAADNTYYSFEILSNGRFSNIHPSNGAEYSVVPAAGVRVVSNGNNFSNCHFEGGYVPLHVVGDGNVFENCDYYAPRGDMCIDLSGTGNRITGITGATYFGGNPDYKGILLRGADNHVELTDIGCSLGVVDFTGDQGGNIVRISGYHSYGVPYVGTPHVSDDVLISVGGPGGGKFVQQLPAPLSTYTPVVTPAGGAITSYTATGKYRKVGKLTELYLDITITNNGTGSGALLVSLPALPVDQGFLAGQEQAISGVSLCARVQNANANASLTNYANANPGGTGARFLISGSYITEA